PPLGGAVPRTVQSPLGRVADEPRSGVTYSVLVPRMRRLELVGAITKGGGKVAPARLMPPERFGKGWPPAPGRWVRGEVGEVLSWYPGRALLGSKRAKPPSPPTLLVQAEPKVPLCPPWKRLVPLSWLPARITCELVGLRAMPVTWLMLRPVALRVSQPVRSSQIAPPKRGPDLVRQTPPSLPSRRLPLPSTTRAWWSTCGATPMVAVEMSLQVSPPSVLMMRLFAPAA